MKVFVTGVGGQLGYDVMNELAKRGYEGVGSDLTPEYSGAQDGSAITTMHYVQLDITDATAVETVLNEEKPDVVVHCAAWTAVDLAEDEENIEKVRAINAGGTQNIATVCKVLGCKMVYISTDYVFDGQGTEPWLPDCKKYSPLNVYGQTKLEGEWGTLKMIFVTVGSQKFQFNRLLKKLDDLVEQGEIREEIFAQIGYSEYEPKNYKYKQFLNRNEFAEAQEKADVVITHGGTGAIIGAVKNGKKVLAVPRLAKYGEHVDDHQIQLLEQFDGMGIIEVCYNLDDFLKLYKKLFQTEYKTYKSNTETIIGSIESFLNKEIK